MDRRQFLKVSGLLPLLPGACVTPGVRNATRSETFVNDIHSRLNQTQVREIVSPRSSNELAGLVKRARASNGKLSIAGGRHAMGGQQFGTTTTLVDMRGLNRLLSLDRERGVAEVEAGIEWPELIDALSGLQKSAGTEWGIVQKQTGADRLTIGGAVAANVHGRGLRLKPFIQDVEALEIVTAKGALRCSRTENRELFNLVVGGYGLFGIVSRVWLRLAPRQKVERVVEVRDVSQVMSAFEQRIAAGFLYGDFQFAIDSDSEEFMRKGVFACYRPVDSGTPISPSQRELAKEDWIGLLYLAHANKAEAFERYASYYLSTNGQVYWSDTQQMGFYPDDYHATIDVRTKAQAPATEVITEIYVPREQLASFMLEARDDFRKNGVQVVYGTVRLIEKDDETFLAWARQSYACIIFNLHTVHTPDGLAHSADAFRRLIDMAIRRGGSYYLTYHRHARRDQVESCYPQFAKFLEMKKELDPELLFQSDWYRHYVTMFGG